MHPSSCFPRSSPFFNISFIRVLRGWLLNGCVIALAARTEGEEMAVEDRFGVEVLARETEVVAARCGVWLEDCMRGE